MRPLSNMSPKCVYLAGPEVFLPDAVEVGRRKKELCEQHGLVGLFPLDAELDLAALPKRQRGLAISRANEELIRGAHLVVANLTPFRSPSLDAGTAYEIGLARGLGLPVYAYTNVAALFRERTLAFLEGWEGPEAAMEVEDFDLTDNLMIDGALAQSGTRVEAVESPRGERFRDLRAFEACLRQIVEDSPR